MFKRKKRRKTFPISARNLNDENKILALGSLDEIFKLTPNELKFTRAKGKS